MSHMNNQPELLGSLGTIGLFGSSDAGYELASEKLLFHSPGGYPHTLQEVIIWAGVGVGHRIVLHPGSTMVDAQEALNISITSSKGCTATYTVPFAATNTKLSVGLWRTPHGYSLRSFLDLGHLLGTTSTPKEGFDALLGYCLALARYLELSYLSLTRDSDVSITQDGPSGVVFPSFVGIFSESVLRLGDRRRLQGAGIALIRLSDGWNLLSVLDLEELLRGAAVPPGARSVFQTYSFHSQPQ